MLIEIILKFHKEEIEKDVKQNTAWSEWCREVSMRFGGTGVNIIRGHCIKFSKKLVKYNIKVDI